MSKHRRPTRLARFRHAGPNPLHVGIAAGVAGTVAITGSVVASASDSTTPTVRTVTDASVARAVAAQVPDVQVNPADMRNTQAVEALRTAVDTARVDRTERLAKAKARAIAKRKAQKLAAERRAALQRAERRASRSRRLATAAATPTASVSGGVERMSASAANVLQLAAAAASGAYYTHGGAGPSGFDCSGFTSYVFSKVGVALPHSSSAQSGVVRRVSSPQPGDLVFVYNGGGGSIGHVAIYAGGGYWWEAANPSMGVGKHRAWSSAVSYGRVL